MTDMPIAITIFKDGPGLWRWAFRGQSGAIVARSRPYASAAACQQDIALMRLCAPVCV